MATQTPQQIQAIANLKALTAAQQASGNADAFNRSNFKLPATPTPTTPPTVKTVFSAVDPNLYKANADTFGNDNTVGNGGNIDRQAEFEANQEAKLGSDSDIYNRKAQLFQKEIDAVNQIYGEKLRQQREVSKGNLGTTTAIAARAGALGSPIGEAQYQGVQNDNNAIEGSIQAEQSAKIAAIRGELSSSVAQEIADKRAAKEAGLSQYLTFLKDKQGRQATRVTNLAKSLLLKGIDINNLDPQQKQDILKNLGTTEADLTAAYATEKATQDKTTSDAEYKKAQLLSEQNKSLPASAQEYEYAKSTGYTGSYNDYQNLDANRRAVIAKAGTSNGGLTPYQLNNATNSISSQLDNEPSIKNYTILKESKRFVDSLPNTTTNPTDDQGLIYALAKALDPSSAVREGEYATAQKYSQSLISSYGKSVSQALNGTGFLTEDARKNIKATINSKYKAAESVAKSVSDEYQRRINDIQSGKIPTIINYFQGDTTTTPTNNTDKTLSEFGL